jgi:HK97 family phage major capsid protein
MTEKMDALIQRMQELTETVKSGHQDPAVLDWENVKTQFGEQIKELVDARVEEKRNQEPVFKGQPVYADKVAPDLKGNRYGTMVKHIGQSGYYTDWANNKIKAVDVWLAHRLFKKGHLLMPDRIAPPSDDLDKALKALTSTGSGTGDELVPTDMAPQLWEDVHLSNVLASNLGRIPMTSNPMDIPNALGDVVFRKGTENVATTAQDPATSKNTLTVTEHLAEVDWSYSLEEDAIVALMPAVRMTIARNAAEYIDGFVLNADSTATTSNINTDSTPGADAYYLSAGQDGIRHQVITDNSTQLVNMAGALTDAGIISGLALMGKYAVDPRQLLYVCDVNTYFKGFLDASTSGAPGTFVKSEADAGYSIIVTGQIAMYRGTPIVIPVLSGKTQADGTISATSASNTVGQLMIPNRNQWHVGFMRDVEIEVDRDIQKRQIIMVVSYRVAVGCRGTRSSATHTAGLRNITV